MNLPFRYLALPLVSVAMSIALAACVHRQPGAGAPAGVNTGPPATGNAPVPEGILRTLDAGLHAGQAWPGFDLRGQVLVVTMLPGGPVYLVGDSAPPPGFRWLDVRNVVAVRDGVPPDSLVTGLRLAMDWNGRQGIATAMSFTDDQLPLLPPFLLHEAFHTHQMRVTARKPGRFEPRSNPAFPDTSVDALALLNLEGTYLAHALRAGDHADARRWAGAAIAVRAHRCGILGEAECARERGIEQNEGTANYVMAALLGEMPGYGAAGVWQDSLAGALSPVPDVERLERWHFYDTGHAWLLLLERLGPAGWKEQVESVAPDQVLAGVLPARPQAMDSIAASARGSAAWTGAVEDARRVVARTLAHRDSAERAFWSRPGVPVRVYFGNPGRTSEVERTLANGLRERTIRFDGNEVTFRGPSRPICCSGEMTIVAVAGRHATVDGRAFQLDRGGPSVSGAVELDLPQVRLRFGDATLSVFADSVTIKAR
jgi:hypothetical protein